jgi:hypothetical protein
MLVYGPGEILVIVIMKFLSRHFLVVSRRYGLCCCGSTLMLTCIRTRVAYFISCAVYALVRCIQSAS